MHGLYTVLSTAMGRHATRTLTARMVPAVMAAAARTGKVIERQADPTLYLRVRAGGRAAAWIQRVRIAGRTVAKGLGSFPVITFQAAKLAALRNRADLAAGRNPFAARVRAVVRTFATAAESCRAAHLSRWSPASVKAFDAVVRNQLAPLAAVPLAGITRERVVDVLAAITNEKQARKARQRAGQILGTPARAGGSLSIRRMQRGSPRRCRRCGIRRPTTTARSLPIKCPPCSLTSPLPFRASCPTA